MQKQMKRYKIEYWNSDKSKPARLAEISKSGKRNGARIPFFVDGRKHWQDHWKNGRMNGLEKEWCWTNPQNWLSKNWKKGKKQGIKINFE